MGNCRVEGIHGFFGEYLYQGWLALIACVVRVDMVERLVSMSVVDADDLGWGIYLPKNEC